jgi:hypothetical protein
MDALMQSYQEILDHIHKHDLKNLSEYEVNGKKNLQFIYLFNQIKSIT